MKKLPFKKVLALSPHTDDVEFGCGGTLHRLLQQGAEVHNAVFSLCEGSVPKGLQKDILLTEMNNAMQTLGVSKENIHVFRYPVRRFDEHRQDILEDLVKLRNDIQPDIVFTPSCNDIHQDHELIAREALRAFRYQSIFAYELPWNNISFAAESLIELSPQNIQAKINAIACYQSQAFRHYSAAELFEYYARLRGIQNKTDLSEAFEVVRLSL